MALGSGVVHVMWTRVQTTSAFPSQPGMDKIWWPYEYIHTDTCMHMQTHIYFSLSLHVHIKALFALEHLSLFSHDVSLPVLQNTKCLKRKYFWLGHIRNLMSLYSVYNMSLRNRYIFPVIWHSRCPIFQFFWSSIYMDTSVFWSLKVKDCFELSYLWLASDQILLLAQRQTI